MEEELENPIVQDILNITNLKTATPDMPRLKPFVLNTGSSSRFVPDNKKQENTNIEENPLIRLDNLKNANKIESIPLGSYSDNARYSRGTRPGDNWEEQYAQNQSWGEKAINGTAKGLLLTGTTFIQSTVGLVNGVVQAISDGKASSFYNNDLNRSIDEINKQAEDNAPNFKTQKELDANWYSPDNFFTANFFWDGIVKNLGFVAGAALSGGVYASILKAIPLIAKLFSVGKAAEALAVTEEGLLGANKLYDTFGKVKELSNKFLSSYNVLNPGGRALVSGLATTGEASIEAYHNLNDFRNEKIKEYINTNGKEPTGFDLENINRLSESVGNTSFLGNVALLTATNYIQFPKILGSSYVAEKNIINNIKKDINEIVKDGAKYIEKPSFIKNKILDKINSVRPYLFSTSEAFEEGSQYAIGLGTKDYYNKKYNKQATNFLDSLSYGVGETLTTNEGLNNVLIGGLSGALMMAKGKYQENKQINKNTQEALQSFNKSNISDFTKDTIDSVNRGTVIQEEREQALKNGEVLQSKDLEADYVINYLSPRIKHGRYDLVKSDIEDTRALASTEEGFNQLKAEGKALETDTQQKYLARLTKLENTADNVKSLYQSLNLRYAGIVDEKKEKVYSSEVLDKMVYTASKVADYDDRLVTLSNTLMQSGVSIDTVLKDVLSGNTTEFNKAVDSITNLDVLEDTKDTYLDTLKDISEIAINRQSYLKDYSEIKKNPITFKESEIIDNTTKEIIKINTVSGESEIELNTEYSILNRSRFNEKGEESKQPKTFKILSKNEDGTFKIQLDNNDVKDVSEEMLTSFEILPITENNNKLKFVEAVEDMFFYHAGIKDSNNKAVKGKLEYNSEADKLQFVYINEQGEVKRTIVDKKFLEPAKGYKQAKISSNELSEEQLQLLNNYISQKQTKEEIVNSKSDKINTRNNIIKNLYEQTLTKLESINNKLEKVSNSLQTQKEKFEKELQEESTTKKGSPRKLQTKKMIQLIKTIADLEEELLEDIKSYQSSKENIEAEIAYLEQFISDLETNDNTENTLIDSIKKDIDKLNKIISSTESSIEKNKNLLEKVQGFIKKVLEEFNSYIEKIKNANPNTLLLGIDDLQKQMFNSLGINGVTYFKANKSLIYNEALDMDSNMQLFEEDLIVPSNTKSTKQIIEKIEELQKELKLIETEKNVKVNIINSFEKYLENIEKEKEVLQKQNIITELTSSHDTTSIPSTNESNELKSFEEKDLKDDYQVLNSGIPSDDSRKADVYDRARRFNFRYLTLPQSTKKELRVVTVTDKTQGLLGFKVLKDSKNLTTELLYDVDASRMTEETDNLIAYAIVKMKEDNSFAIVNEFGEFLTEQELLNPEKHFVAQLMPKNDLLNGTQFRDNENPTPKREAEVKILTAQHVANRAKILSKTTLDTPTLFTVSLGKAIVKNKDEAQSSSPLEANLITKETLTNKKVLSVVKTGTNKGTVTLDIEDKKIPLNNRKLNDDEVNNVFNSVRIISEELTKNGTTKNNQKITSIYNWLKTIVYWNEVPNSKSAVYYKMVTENNEKVIKLFIGSNSFIFTPTSIKENESAIKEVISNLYHNINSSEIDKFSNYSQIEIFNSENNPVFKTWNTYQEYLISSQESVLTTSYFATTSQDVPNRTGIYITAINDSENISQPKPTGIVNASLEKKERKENTPFSVETKLGRLSVFYDETNELRFDTTEVNDDIIEKLIVIGSKAPEFAALERSSKDINNTETQEASARGTLLAKAKEILELENITKEETEPIKETTDSQNEDLETKKADIEKRRQKEVKNSFIYYKDKIRENGKAAYEYFQDSGYLDKNKAPFEDVVASRQYFFVFSMKSYQGYAEKFNEINAKYDTELAELEKENNTTKAKSEAPIKLETSEKLTKEQKQAEARKAIQEEQANDPDQNFRVVGKNTRNIVLENFDKVAKDIKKMLPNISVFRTRNIIQATNGRQAYGMFHNAAIYLYDKAEQGTAYHEVFEAVWGMTTNKTERKSVIRDFRNRKGSFTEYGTGKIINYNEATEFELKEELAEEFRKFILFDKYKVKTSNSTNLVSKIFREILDTLKAFFIGKDSVLNTEELFKRIGNGYYAKHIPQENKLSIANIGIQNIDSVTTDNNSQFRFVDISSLEINQIMQDMTYYAITDMMKGTNNIFDFAIPKTSKEVKEMYQELQKKVLNRSLGRKITEEEKMLKLFPGDEDIQKQIEEYYELYENIKNQWNDISKKHIQYLAQYDLRIDDELLMEESERGKDDTYADKGKEDVFKNMNAVVRLSLAIIQKKTKNGDGTYSPNINSTGGFDLLPVGQVYGNLMSALNNSTDLTDFVEKLHSLTLNKPQYSVLFSRIFKLDPKAVKINDFTDKPIFDYSVMSKDDVRLLQNYYTSFNKQVPDVKIQSNLENGDIQISEGNLSQVTREAKMQFIENIKNTVLQGTNNYLVKSEKGYRATNAGLKYLDDANWLKLGDVKFIEDFLDNIGIVFEKEHLQKLAFNQEFVKTINYMLQGFGKLTKADKELKEITVKRNSLNMDGDLFSLAEFKTKYENTEFNSTYFNVEGEQQQSAMQPNWLSKFSNVIKQVKNKADLANTVYNYLAKDSYSTNSVILKRLFSKEGERKDISKSLEDILNPIVINGVDNFDDKNKAVKSLNEKERLTLEINNNFAGVYYVLVPGDASTQNAMKMHESMSSSEKGFVNGPSIDAKFLEIFEGYFIDELKLTKEQRIIHAKRKNNELRFFKGILSKELHDKVVQEYKEKDKATDDNTENAIAREVYDNNKTSIDKELISFLDKTYEDKFKQLESFGIIKYIGVLQSGQKQYKINDISVFKSNEVYSEDAIKNLLKAQVANFMIANIEYHKLIFGDPYLYKDELKRIKNFLSPAQAIPHGNYQMDTRLNELWNEEENIKEFKKQSKEENNKHVSFVTDFTKTSFRTSVVSDIKSYVEELGYDIKEDKKLEDGTIEEGEDNSVDETDGQGLITDIVARQIEIVNGTWGNKEAQYLYDQAFFKLKENELFGLNYKLTELEKAQWEKGNPKNQANYTGIKPIVAGNKEMGRNQNDIVLDKYALFNMSYRLIYENNPNANALQLYRNMRRDNIDYVVYESGRKVGVEKVYPLYKVIEKDSQLFGEINTDVFGADDSLDINEPKTVINIPKAIFSIQGIVPTKEKEQVIQGSQPTKLVSMDFSNGGVFIDFMPELNDFQKKYDLFYNKNSKERIEYNNRKERTLQTIIKSNFDISKARMQDGLERSIKKLGITDNTDGTYTLSDKSMTIGFLRSQLLTRDVNSNIIEALEKYATDELVLEAIPAYQQIRNILYSIANKEISSPNISGRQAAQFSSALFEGGLRKVKQKTVKGEQVDLYESDILEFYINEEGKRTCEIMISKWFKNPFDTDDELLDYLNNTSEGQKILSGVAYRIPTQKQNSIESFVIKKFLPDEYKDSVIVPSALTKKVGSDFDIDKLFIYFKQVYFDSKTKELKMLPYYGIGQEAKDKIKEDFKKGVLNEYISYKKKSKNLLQDDKFNNLMDALGLEEFEDSELAIINIIYRESLDNEYIATMQELISHELNFANLVKPNSAKQLQAITKIIDDKKGNKPVDFFNVTLMLDQLVMSKYRHNLITGKYNIGIAATGQTGNAQGQKGLITLNFDKLDAETKKLFANGGIKFRNYNQVNGKPTISLIMDANPIVEERNFISDIIGQIIDGFVDITKDDWIMRLGLTKNMAGTFIALVRLGVPAKEVGFFMNQPIIDAHLKMLTNAGLSGISNKTKTTIGLFKSKVKSELEYLPYESELLDTIGKDISQMSEIEKADQLFIFNEFLKYSKIAEDLLTVTQATNFDTATFNDPSLINKKVMQLEEAKNTMFEGIEVLLEDTHIQQLADSLVSFKNATGTILKPTRKSMEDVINQVTKRYIDLNDGDFVSLSKKVVFTLFDWAVQTNTHINKLIPQTMLPDSNSVSVASKMITLKNITIKDTKHQLHNNYVLKLLEIRKGEKEGEVDNLYLKALSNKVYDQDYIIESFRELKKYLYDTNQNKLFDDFMNLAILQSGLTNSKLSFTNLIPLDEFEKKYADTLAVIDTLLNLQEFYDAHIFERANTRDTNNVKDIVEYGETSKKNVLDSNLVEAQKDGRLPKLIKIPTIGKDGSKDFITLSQFGKKYLMKKVYKSDGTPLFDEVVYEDNSIKEKYFIFKALNTLGNNMYAKEFYNTNDTTLKPGIINNGYEKVLNEVEDSVIENIYNTQIENTLKNTENQNTEQISLPEKIENKKYELFPGVEANTGQKEAIDKLEEFLKSNKKEFLLQGKGGTGKTTIIKKLLENINSFEVIAIAPTHKAKKVLSRSINQNKNKKFNTITLASALAIKLDENTGKFEKDLFAKSVPIKGNKYVIIDESSMISDDLLEEIKKEAPYAKIIYMGDKAQLPPVGQETDSKVFDIQEGYELLEKMRQAKTSPIINIGTKIASNVENNTNRVLNIIENSDRVNTFDNISGSSIVWEENEDNALNQFVEDYKKEPTNTNNVKIITFNNQNHNNPQSVKNLNAKIRAKLFGDKSSEQFIKGEIVTAYSAFNKDAGQDQPLKVLENAEDFIIKSVSSRNYKNTVNVYSKKAGNRSFSYNYDILDLELINDEGQPILESTVPVIANSSKEKFKSDLATLWQTDKQLAFALQNEFADLEYGYTITSHKAQGSTYNNVYVMEDNILGSSNGGSIKAKNQSLYVAVSRPSQKLVMVSSKNVNVKREFEYTNVEKIENNQILESSETFEEKEIGNPKELIRPKTISLSDWNMMTIKEQIRAIEEKDC